jgi:hypothetical protein
VAIAVGVTGAALLGYFGVEQYKDASDRST